MGALIKFLIISPDRMQQKETRLLENQFELSFIKSKSLLGEGTNCLLAQLAKESVKLA